MFFPAYQLDIFKSESEALESVELTTENLKESLVGAVVSGDAPDKSNIRIVKGDGTMIFFYLPDQSVSVWFSDDYWECDELDEAQELIESVEGGIPAEYWAIFSTKADILTEH